MYLSTSAWILIYVSDGVWVGTFVCVSMFACVGSFFVCMSFRIWLWHSGIVDLTISLMQSEQFVLDLGLMEMIRAQRLSSLFNKLQQVGLFS